jgi:hypothetical protein
MQRKRSISQSEGPTKDLRSVSVETMRRMKQLLPGICQHAGFVFALVAIFIAPCIVPPSAGAEMLTVTVKENQSIRDIAQEYLGDPNLWIDILRANGIESAVDVRTGISLRIPATALARLKQALEGAWEVIDEATMAGARLFAPEIIASAIETHDRAIVKRNMGHYDESCRLAHKSKEKALKARDICIANQNSPAQAIINYRKGTVQQREAESRIWTNALVNTILLEGEWVRTLSESYAGILFRDDSRLRLEGNSLALIQKMRSNKLDNTENSSVSLLEGDLSVFLGSNRGGENFKLELPDIQTNINSHRFWVSRDDEATRFANYDGELEISTDKDRVVIGRNQGSMIDRRRQKINLHELLQKTNLISPPPFARSRGDRLVFEWEPVKGAHSYWLEMTNDKVFDRIFFSKKNVNSTQYELKNIPQEVYYWRVTALDQYGLPGLKSEVRVVNVLHDTIPPYLRIIAPAKEAVVHDSIITIVGEAELGATVSVEGNELMLEPAGSFRSWIALSPGKNNISIEARDNVANVTCQQLDVTYLPDKELGAFDFDGSINQVGINHFLIQGKGFILIGKTVKGSRIDLKSTQSSYRAHTYVDDSGFFHLSVPTSHPREEFVFTQRTLSGQAIEDRLLIEVSAAQPVIQLTHPLPDVTTERSLTLSGRLVHGTILRINGREVDLTKGEFTETLDLKPGTNWVRVEARDKVKNLAIIEKEVVLDRQAPSLSKVELSKNIAEGGELVRIEVYARDRSRMKRAAPFTVKASNFVYDGFLILSREKGVYIGNVQLPQHTHGRIKLVRVLLEDYYGNRKEYLF